MVGPPPDREPLSRRFGRLAVGCAGIGVVAAALVGAAALGTYVFLRTDAGNEFLRERVEGALQGLTPYGDIEIGRLRTDLWNDLALYDVRVLDEEGETLAFVERALLDMDLGVLSRRIIRLPRARLDGVYVDIEQREDGVLNLARVFGQTEPGEPSDEEWTGLPVLLDIPDLVVNGAHVIYRTPEGEVLRAVGIDLRTGIYGKETVEVRDLYLTGLLAEPGPTAIRIDGSAAWNADGLRLTDTVVTLPHSQVAVDGTIGDTFDATVEVRRINFPTIDPLIGQPGLTGTYRGELRVTGPVESPAIEGTLVGVGDTVGALGLDIRIHGDEDPVRIAGEVTADDYHLHHLVPEVDEPVILNGTAVFELLAAPYPDAFVLDVRYRGGRQVAYGQVAESLAAHIRIEDGVLLIDEADVTGIVGEVTVEGRINLETGDMRLDVDGVAEPRYLANFGVEGLGTPANIDVTVEGNIERLDTQPIIARGVATWTPFRYEADVAFGRVHARFEARVRPGEIVTGTANVTATNGRAFGVDLGEAVVPDLRFRVPLDGGTSVFQGNVVAEAVSMPDAFAVERLRGPFTVTAPPGADPIVETRLELGPHDVLGFPGTSGRVTARLEGDDVQFDVELRQEGRPTLVTDGTFDLGTQEVVLEELVLAPTPRATWTAERPVRFRLTDGGIAEADIALAGELGRIEVRGTLGTEGPLDAAVVLTDLQLDTFAELFPEQVSGLAGELDLTATLSGRAADPVITAEIDLDGLWVEDTVRWLDVEGEITATRQFVRPELRIGVAGEPLAVLWGEIPVVLDLANPRLATARDLDVTVAIRPGSLHRFELMSPAIEPDSLPPGAVSAVLEADGPLGDPDFRFAGVAELEVENWVDPARFEFDLRRDAEELAFWADVREGFEQRANVSGTAETDMGQAITWALGGGERPDLDDLELWIDDMLVNGVLLGMPASHLLAATDADIVVTGDIVGGFSVSGSPYTPVVEGGLHWLDGSIGEIELEGAFASITPIEDAYEVDVVLDFQGEGGLEIDGIVPIRLDLREDVETWTAGDLDVAISGPGVPLEVVAAFDPGIRSAEGLVVIEGQLGGPIGDPTPDLVARLDDGALVYEPLGLRFYNIDLELLADARRIQLTELVMNSAPIRRNVLAGGLEDLGETEESRIAAAGTARLEDWTPTGVVARVDLSNSAWVAATPETQLRMNGEVLASGTWPNVDISGSLQLRRGNVMIDTATFLAAAPLRLDPDIELVRPGMELVAREEPEPPLYRDFNVSVALDVERNLYLDMQIPWVDDLGTFGATVTQANIESRLGGRLEIALVGGEPALQGEVEVIEGRVRVLRSRFDTLEGSLVFLGGDPSNPILDLAAEMNLAGGSLEMFITGPAEEPQIAFQSEAYPDQTEQLAIVITGRAPEDLGGNQAQATAEALAGVFLNTLFSGQALTNVTIDPEGAVEVGVPIGANLFATTRLAPSADIDENRIAAAVEWSLGRRLVLSGGVGDRLGWADIFWEIRF